ncbi:hypothetical protein KDK95_00255 [Actinospica sp. MGRD01-02]|uniref:Uncharacterized protein n=1 Tax=Actinospica acidithermotolerans TaxID=2828514 RepID=A0A941E6K5_9ACTN|nr:hypothetical protein [Actinospica acidithermotolerans]MBR7824722.1 hypothetical protein [Actinospica acidithermotolerans]
MLVVQGGPTTAVVRGREGESVVLLSGELPAELTDESLAPVLDLAAAVLDDAEMQLFLRCLDRLRAGDTTRTRRVEVDGAVLTVHSHAADVPQQRAAAVIELC